MGNEVRIKTVVKDEVSGPLDKIKDKFELTGKKAVLMGAGVAAGQMAFGLIQGAIGSVTAVLGDSIKAFQDDQVSQSKLRASLEANVPAYDGNSKAIEDVLASRMRLGFSDDEQRDSLAKLVTRTHDSTKALELQRLAMDLARLRGMDLASASELVGKAFSGQVGALRKAGIAVDANATATEALAAVQRAANGQAEAYAGTNAGKLAASQVKVGEAMEKLGESMSYIAATVLPVLADGITGLVDVITGLGVGTEHTMDQMATAAANGSESARLHLNALKKTAESTADGWDESTNAIVTSVEGMKGGIVWNSAKSASAIANIGDAADDTADDAEDSFGDVVAAAKKMGKALTSLANDAIDDYFDPIIARDKLMANQAEIAAQKRILSSGKATAAEKRDARAALHELSADNLKLRVELAAAGKLSNKEQSALLADLKSKYKTSSGAARLELQRLIDKIEAIPTHVNVSITTSYKGGYQGGARASGGPVSAGTPYLVGEEGPELFTPSSSGSISTASATRAMARTGGMGGSPRTVTVVLALDSQGIQKIASVVLDEAALSGTASLIPA